MEDAMLEFLVAAVLAVLAFLAWMSSKPDVFRVERALTIKAPAETIFPLINDLHAWQGWSPWAKKDPAAKAEFSGPPNGLGAAFAWDGNKLVGKGRMEVVESTPDEKVAFRLDFEKPFVGHNRAEFTLVPAGEATTVRWVMTGPMPLFSKVMSSFFDMDKMIGRDFEAGLASIKEIVER
jgi:Polyketide cyclase / dehydrase and lipid transport